MINDIRVNEGIIYKSSVKIILRNRQKAVTLSSCRVNWHATMPMTKPVLILAGGKGFMRHGNNGKEELMKIKHIDHIGIAVKSIEQAGKFYTEILGLKIQDIENVADQKVNVAFLPITDSEVELLESTEPDGPVSKYIDARGQGVQHIAFRVENIEEALEELKSKGVRLIDQTPRKGAGGAKIAFVHPKETNGVLVEICERD